MIGEITDSSNHHNEKCAFIDKSLEEWQQILGLDHWVIHWHECSKLTQPFSPNLMEILPTRSRHSAKILIKTSTITVSSKADLQKLLLHELTHLLYEPLAEEHFFQMQFSTDTARKEESTVRFRRSLEKAVEQTSQALDRLRPCQEKQLKGK